LTRANEIVRERESSPVEKIFLTNQQAAKAWRREARLVRSVGNFRRCFGIRQIHRSADSNFRLALRVPGFSCKNRWVTKTDLSPVPLNKSAIQSVTPSQVYEWEGPGPNVLLTGTTEERMPSEQKWYALTGRVVGLKVRIATTESVSLCTRRKS